MPTLMQLRYFQALAENGHLTKTAESLLISQTALSNMLAHLEDELGIKLFDRIGRSICLNAYGKAYLVHASSHKINFLPTHKLHIYFNYCPLYIQSI